MKIFSTRIVSAYHFFCEKKDDKDTVIVQPYVDLFEVEDVNHFAELFFTGNFYYGDYYKYNDEWKTEFKELHPEAEILYLNYENLKCCPETNVMAIANFLDIGNFNAREVAEKSNFKKASKQDISKTRETDFHSKLYRAGKSEAWKTELDQDTVIRE